MKGKLSFFAKLTLLAILCFLFVVMIQINMQINNLKAEYNAVAAELAAQEELVLKLQAEVDAPVTEETIRNKAREDLGLCNPGDIIYESDSPN